MDNTLRIDALKKKFAGYPNILEFIEIQVSAGNDVALQVLEHLDPSNPVISFSDFENFIKDVVLEGAKRVARGEPWHG